MGKDESTWSFGHIGLDISGIPIGIGTSGCFTYIAEVGKYTITLNHLTFDSSTTDRYFVTVGMGEIVERYFGLLPPG
jgi:hypothetical protein